MQSTELDEKYFLERAHKRVENKDYKRAINDFTRAIRINPENIDSYLLRAKAKIECGLLDKAIDDLSLYFKNNQKSTKALLERGHCYELLHQKDLALIDYEKAAKLGSNIARDRKAVLETHLKHYTNKVKEISDEIQIKPNDKNKYFERAVAKSKQFSKDYSSILKDLDKAIELDKSFEEAYFFRGSIKQEILSSNDPDALSDLEIAKELNLNKRLIKEKLNRQIYIKERNLDRNFDEPLKGEKLKIVIYLLKDKYKEDEIARACGYDVFEEFYKELKFLKLTYEEPLEKEAQQFSLFEKNINSLEEPFSEKNTNKKLGNLFVDKSFLKNSSYHLGQLYIYKNCLCEKDGEHHGIVFIPARLVKESKNWDYSKAELKDWNIKNIINDFMEDEDEALEMMNHYSFKEPMQYIEVEQYWYLNENLETEEWFEEEEQADFYGLRYEDCDPKSSWCDG